MLVRDCCRRRAAALSGLCGRDGGYHRLRRRLSRRVRRGPGVGRTDAGAGALRLGGGRAQSDTAGRPGRDTDASHGRSVLEGARLMMTTTRGVQELEQALAEIPLLDAPTHLIGGKLAAPW